MERTETQEWQGLTNTRMEVVSRLKMKRGYRKEVKRREGEEERGRWRKVEHKEGSGTRMQG